MATRQLRVANSNAKRSTVETTIGGFAKLLSLGTYDRNELTVDDLDRIRDLVDTLGEKEAAERVGVGAHCLMRVCAGFGHRCRPETGAKIRKFLGLRRVK